MNDHGKEQPMGTRGVTRPMAEHAVRSGDRESEQHSHDQHSMSRDERHSMLQMHHRHTLWVYWTLPLLGIWLVLAPFHFGYLNENLWVDPSGGRGPWFAEQSTQELRSFRAWLMTGSDVISGILLLVFGWRSLRPDRPKDLWACCFVGVWLTLAPVLFWAPTAAAYANDSLVGILVIALTILIPGMPNMIMYMQHGPATPPGWTYNPSSWPQRWIMIVTGFLGFLISRYLAMYQLGYIHHVWDPVFGFEAGTQRVLDSKMSHMWPISDGGLGAVSYTFEFLMGYMGSKSRWRTMPWMVAFFGVLVIPLGLTHIILVISQPLIVHHWCLMCLLAALVMLPMIPLEVDEVVAMLQHVRQAKERGDRGGSLWAIFWLGGSSEGCTEADRAPPMLEFPSHPWKLVKASIWGMSFPWTLVLSSLIGVGIVCCPTWFGIDIRSTAADVGHLGGALIMTVSVLSMGEVIRTSRFLNIPLGLTVAIGPWFVGSSTGYCIAAFVLGVGAVVLAIPRGRVAERYGSWDRFIQ